MDVERYGHVDGMETIALIELRCVELHDRGIGLQDLYLLHEQFEHVVLTRHCVLLHVDADPAEHAGFERRVLQNVYAVQI